MKTKRASRRGRHGRGHNGSMQRGRDIGHFFHPGALRPVPLEWPASPRAVSRARSSVMLNKLVHQHRQQESDKHLDVHPPACVNPINLAPPEAHSHIRAPTTPSQSSPHACGHAMYHTPDMVVFLMRRYQQLLADHVQQSSDTEGRASNLK